jgi:hypothetical protein
LRNFKDSKNQNLKKEYSKIMVQWKKIVKPEESADKKNKNPKPKTPSKNNAKEKDDDDFPEKKLVPRLIPPSRIKSEKLMIET